MTAPGGNPRGLESTMRLVRALKDGAHRGPKAKGREFQWKSAGDLPTWVELVTEAPDEEPAEEAPKTVREMVDAIADAKTPEAVRELTKGDDRKTVCKAATIRLKQLGEFPSTEADDGQ